MSEGMFSDLKEISHRFIEVGDLKADGIFIVTEENLNEIKDLVDKFSSMNISEYNIENKKSIYKQVYFLSQYLQMLLENGNESNSALTSYHNKLLAIKQKMLKDPELLLTIVEVQEIDEDRKTKKLLQKEMKKMMKDLSFNNNKNLSLSDIKKAQLMFTKGAVGEGNIGTLLLVLIVKFLQFLKRIITSPFSSSDNRDQE